MLRFSVLLLLACLLYSYVAQPGNNSTFSASPSLSATITVNYVPGNTNSTAETGSEFLGLETWEWILIGVGAGLVLLCCCVGAIIVWLRYKAWKFNSDWKDDNIYD